MSSKMYEQVTNFVGAKVCEFKSRGRGISLFCVHITSKLNEAPLARKFGKGDRVLKTYQ